MKEQVLTSVFVAAALSVSRGSSDEAQFLEQESKNGVDHLRSSVSLGKGIESVLNELAETAHECGEPGWAGHASAAVQPDAYANAVAFVKSLPLGTPMPEVGVEPDGHLTLEWHCDPRHTLSVSIGPEGELYYAALLGRKKQNGAMPFYNSVPVEILGLIYKTA